MEGAYEQISQRRDSSKVPERLEANRSSRRMDRSSKNRARSKEFLGK